MVLVWRLCLRKGKVYLTIQTLVTSCYTKNGILYLLALGSVLSFHFQVFGLNCEVLIIFLNHEIKHCGCTPTAWRWQYHTFHNVISQWITLGESVCTLRCTICFYINRTYPCTRYSYTDTEYQGSRYCYTAVVYVHFWSQSISCFINFI